MWGMKGMGIEVGEGKVRRSDWGSEGNGEENGRKRRKRKVRREMKKEKGGREN